MALTAVCLTIALAAAKPLPALRVVGNQLIDPAGKPVLLKGTNLGNWFVIEPWMLGWTEGSSQIADQFEIEQTLAKRFGTAEKERLMDLYRSNWITVRDFKSIRSFGMNVVRLPMNYRLMEDDSQPMQLRKDAFKWIDKAVEMAASEGLYTILDMHGVQGGQSVYDHTGRAGQNHLWDQSANQQRLAWLWGELAKRYRDNPAVVAYDVFNEPYGGSHSQIKSVFSLCYQSIRKSDPEKLIFAMGSYDGFSFYGTPQENKWHNVGYQMHYYPGLFGGGDPIPQTHADHIAGLTTVAAESKRFQGPFLVGEMNVVFKAAGGGPLMRKYYDLHAGFGWHTTMWSYRINRPDAKPDEDSWGMVSNQDPTPKIDIKKSSKADIEQFFRSLGTMRLRVNESLRGALMAKSPPRVDLPSPPVRRTAAPKGSWPGWELADIGGDLPGGVEDLGGGAFALYGSGADIWGQQDAFSFLYKRVAGDFSAQAEVKSLERIEAYSKAGLMVRASGNSESPHVLLSLFPSGEVQMAFRASAGETTQGYGDVGRLEFGRAWIRVTRQGQTIAGEISSDGKNWRLVKSVQVSGWADSLMVGVVCLSHRTGWVGRAEYRGVNIQK